ncbi:hypothetical protein QO058_03135 [Bosea vestrisii]|uniref:hypothetical protein n=1 Tax=Bosea vestrisii TaxID=151416 RepID=UPI0024DFC585|nr:hypothetical protein [Bosea vestrisii]WID97285.1 hypothetical protein QO058_03135 [Bosea vestrisii]
MFFKRKPASAWAQDEEVATQAAAPAPKEKLGWFEKRARRRRRRIVFEEVLGWILVPAFLYLLWLGYRAIGGVPKEIVDFGNELMGLVMKSF